MKLSLDDPHLRERLAGYLALDEAGASGRFSSESEEWRAGFRAGVYDAVKGEYPAPGMVELAALAAERTPVDETGGGFP